MNKYKYLSIVLISLVIISGCKKDIETQTPAPVIANETKKLIKVPLTRQALGYTCGAAALQSILYYNGIEYGEGDLAELLGSNSTIGTPVENIVSFANSLDFNVETKEDASFDELKNYIDNNKPVMVLIQAWTSQTNVDWKNEWEAGHYVVAVGYDQNNVYFMDPYTLGNYAYIPKSEFMDRWHDVDSANDTLSHFILSIQKEPLPSYDPNKILKID